ncbi:hypothetical protein BBOR36S_01677 [Brevibacillus borstelensis]|jgi:hypothetical protein
MEGDLLYHINNDFLRIIREEKMADDNDIVKCDHCNKHFYLWELDKLTPKQCSIIREEDPFFSMRILYWQNSSNRRRCRGSRILE